MKLKYTNLNPLNKRELDCVCRAISYATNNDYNIIMGQLYAISSIYTCERLCVCCYEKLIEDVYKFNKVFGFKGKKIKDIIWNGIYLIRVNGHLTCVDNDNIIDTWNCGNEIVDIVWKVR